jgi:hypothetical protein
LLVRYDCTVLRERPRALGATRLRIGGTGVKRG